MVLLILSRLINLPHFQLYLHSNMVLLICLKKMLEVGVDKDLHSNMVLLIFLYILDLTYLYVYLHSNMVLLISPPN